jgi:poly(3-hydroxybutyrate) depolymerase
MPVPNWATASPARTVQRGARYPATLTDFKTRGRLVATLCVVNGLGHAWSGGAAGLPYSDPKGPDASHMIWAFAVKAFARSAAGHLAAARRTA